ncbi:uncharacterized protein LOC122828963 isoform X1 [Gambusia affinis]|uniref:uncharacterized protein LOC122828963 isoform X1 n=1 Tax=Gambusia affinis TaxID=33528 RepID=UPI001CDCBEFC|nr:uncharacterized protein LOC122828963 isoform X1 [Gambusia affinis]
MRYFLSLRAEIPPPRSSGPTGLRLEQRDSGWSNGTPVGATGLRLEQRDSGWSNGTPVGATGLRLEQRDLRLEQRDLRLEQRDSGWSNGISGWSNGISGWSNGISGWSNETPPSRSELNSGLGPVGSIKPGQAETDPTFTQAVWTDPAAHPVLLESAAGSGSDPLREKKPCVTFTRLSHRFLSDGPSEAAETRWRSSTMKWLQRGWRETSFSQVSDSSPIRC